MNRCSAFSPAFQSQACSPAAPASAAASHARPAPPAASTTCDPPARPAAPQCTRTPPAVIWPARIPARASHAAHREASPARRHLLRWHRRPPADLVSSQSMIMRWPSRTSQDNPRARQDQPALRSQTRTVVPGGRAPLGDCSVRVRSASHRNRPEHRDRHRADRRRVAARRLAAQRSGRRARSRARAGCRAVLPVPGGWPVPGAPALAVFGDRGKVGNQDLGSDTGYPDSWASSASVKNLVGMCPLAAMTRPSCSGRWQVLAIRVWVTTFAGHSASWREVLGVEYARVGARNGRHLQDGRGVPLCGGAGPGQRWGNPALWVYAVRPVLVAGGVVTGDGAASTVAGGSVISLPKGGGAVSGLGETFSPDLFTGTGSFSVPIAVPPGRRGLQPDLALAYSTGNGNGPFGLGWALTLPGVARKTSRGVPRYADSAADGAGRTRSSCPAPRILSRSPAAGRAGCVTGPAPRGCSRGSSTCAMAAAIFGRCAARTGWLPAMARRGPVTLARAGLTRRRWPIPAAGRTCSRWRITQTRDPLGNLIRYDYLRDRGERGRSRVGSAAGQPDLLRRLRRPGSAVVPGQRGVRL